MENVDFSRAYDYIRGRILNGEFPSGRALMADVLAAKIGLSRTPVRDALRQLAADGLVTIRPRVGASVRMLSLNEYGEMAGLRMAMEIYAAGLAARLRTAADLKEMAAAHASVKAETERLIGAAEIRSYPPGVTSEHLVREDIRFHMALTTAARNELIKREIIRHQLINRIVTNSGSHIDSSRPAPHSQAEIIALAQSTVREHQAIFDAISRGDTAAARVAMERHLQEDFDSVLHRMAGAENERMERELTARSWPAKKGVRKARARARPRPRV